MTDQDGKTTSSPYYFDSSGRLIIDNARVGLDESAIGRRRVSRPVRGMDALEAIHKRRSTRRFTGDSVPRSDLEAIVDAGRLAATGNNRQPWDFVVVTDPAMIDRFRVAGAWMEKAGAVVAVVMDPASRWWVEDGAAAIENMLLASVALGYGACWVEGDALPREEQFKTLLGVPADRRLMALIPIGVAEETPAVEKKPLAKVLHWERY